jgi:type IV pilus assembly protein PilM
MPILNTVLLSNVLGLDLGSHSIKGVELQQGFRGFQALQLRSLPRDDAEFPLGELVRRFVRLYRFQTEHVVAAIPGDRMTTRRLSFPFRDARQLARAVPNEVADDLPFELEDVVVSWQPVGNDRSKAEVVACIVPRREVASCLEGFQAAGCEPRTLEAEGLVLGNLAAVFDLPGARMLVDLGHRKTCLCLLLDGRAVASRSVPVGGAALTAALAEDRGLAPADAERAKCEEGIALRGRGEPGPRCQAVLDRISREILRTGGSLEAALGGRPISELTLLGGGARLEQIDALLTRATGIRAERLGLPPPGRDHGLAAGGDPLLFAPAIALAVRGTAQHLTRMNFRQDEFAPRIDYLGRFQRDFRWTAALAATAMALAVVGFATRSFLDARRAGDFEAEIARLYGEAFPGRPVPASPMAALRQSLGEANELAEFLGVYRGNLSALDLLGEVSRLVPKDLEVTLDELSIDRQTIRMRVYAKSFASADRLREELAKFPAFTQARIGAIEDDKKRGGKRFNVTIGLAPQEARE